MKFRVQSAGIAVTATTKGASGNTLYTAPDNHNAEITYCSCANTGGTARLITVELYDPVADEYWSVAENLTVEANNTVLIADGGLWLPENGRLVFSADTGSNLQAFCSANLYFI